MHWQILLATINTNLIFYATWSLYFFLYHQKWGLHSAAKVIPRRHKSCHLTSVLKAHSVFPSRSESSEPLARFTRSSLLLNFCSHSLLVFSLSFLLFTSLLVISPSCHACLVLPWTCTKMSSAWSSLLPDICGALSLTCFMSSFKDHLYHVTRSICPYPHIMPVLSLLVFLLLSIHIMCYHMSYILLICLLLIRLEEILSY